jgi:hypothetical protein
MENKEEFKPEDYITINYFWKHILITFSIITISLIVALGFISYGFNLMSKSSTFYFILGILINAASVVMVFFVFNFQLSKSKTLLRGKKFEEKNK